MINFDDKTNRVVNEHNKLTFKVRAESIVKLSTKSKGHGIISKKNLVRIWHNHWPGKVMDAVRQASWTHWKKHYDSPHVELEEIENDYILMFSNSVVENSWLSKLRQELRTDHLNSEGGFHYKNLYIQWRVLLTRRQTDLHYSSRTYYSHSNNRLNAGLNTKPYGISEIHREEVQK